MRNIILPLFAAAVAWAAPSSALYQQKCANCHGPQGQNTAMGKSKAIAGLPPEEILRSLEGYASGEKPALRIVSMMKKNFLKSATPEEVRELAEYIRKLGCPPSPDVSKTSP